jgi:hypothetical protein
MLSTCNSFSVQAVRLMMVEQTELKGWAVANTNSIQVIID